MDSNNDGPVPDYPYSAVLDVLRRFGIKRFQRSIFAPLSEEMVLLHPDDYGRIDPEVVATALAREIFSTLGMKFEVLESLDIADSWSTEETPEG